MSTFNFNDYCELFINSVKKALKEKRTVKYHNKIKTINLLFSDIKFYICAKNDKKIYEEILTFYACEECKLYDNEEFKDENLKKFIFDIENKPELILLSYYNYYEDCINDELANYYFNDY